MGRAWRNIRRHTHVTIDTYRQQDPCRHAARANRRAEGTGSSRYDRTIGAGARPTRGGSEYRYGDRTLLSGRIGIVLAAVVVGALNAILLLGAAGDDIGAPPGTLGGFVLVLDVALVLSSALLGFRFARLGQRTLAAVFCANVVVFVVATAWRATGRTFRPALLFAADLYWLHLYVVVLARYGWRILHIGGPSHGRQ